MGKKKGKDKKGKGAEKTALKTDRKAERKQRKELERRGEDDIEKLIAEFQEKDRKRAEVTEVKCDPPSPRCNMSLTPHPDREELIMFGGEFFNGKQTYVYNDMYVYNIRTQEWTKVTTPNMPPPRCAHQAVALPQDGGQLWVFGGEFASPSQSQFYHYKELWMYSLREKTWNKINAAGGPTSRSGHRMVACKKLLMVFGGFHDNIRDYKYYNDMHAFSVETYTWIKLEITGTPPAPRSGCVMAVTEDQNKLLVYGGYSKEKIKRDVDKGKTHTDMYCLSVDSRCKQESAPTKWKWQSVRQSGYRPSPRCGCSLVIVPGNRAVVFGGVFDKEEDEEEVTGEFYNDMYSLELDRSKWHKVSLKGSKDAKSKKKRRRKKDAATSEGAENEDEEDGEDPEEDEDEEAMDVEEEMESLKVVDTEAAASGDGASSEMETDVFTVKVAAKPSGECTEEGNGEPEDITEEVSARAPVVPGPRMNTLLAVKHGVLYMYGGAYEEGDRQYTLSDMYSLDLHKLTTWNTIIECNLDLQDWQESEESSGEEEEEDEVEGAAGGEDMEAEDDDEDDDDEDDDDDDDDEDDDTPEVEADQSVDDFFKQHEIYWITKATATAESEGLKVTAKQIKKAAFRMAKENHEYQIKELNS